MTNPHCRISRWRLRETNVMQFPLNEPRPATPLECLAGIAETDLTEVMIVGYDGEGRMLIVGSNPNLADQLYMLEAAKLELMDWPEE